MIGSERLERLGRELGRLGAGALLVVAESARDPDLAPLVGPIHVGESFLLLPAGGEAHLGYLDPMEREEAARSGCRLLDPETLGLRALRREQPPRDDFWAALLARALRLCGLEPQAVGLAGRLPAGDLHGACAILEREGWGFRSAHRALLLGRKSKDEAEISAARRAADGACAALRRVAEILAAARPHADGLRWRGGTLTAGLLRLEIAAELGRHGLDQPEGNIVASGGEAAVPHSQGGSEAVIRPGRALVVDLFPRGRLFADCTRTFCVGDPGPQLAAAHRTVEEVLEAARREAAPGARGWELQQAACERFEAAGYATSRSDPGGESGYVHGLGHGVGFELHEYPTFRERAGEEGKLQAGDLFTLEPGLYRPEAAFGVRIEDLCALGDGGLEVLTPLPTALDPSAWA